MPLLQSEFDGISISNVINMMHSLVDHVPPYHAPTTSLSLIKIRSLTYNIEPHDKPLLHLNIYLCTPPTIRNNRVTHPTNSRTPCRR